MSRPLGHSVSALGRKKEKVRQLPSHRVGSPAYRSGLFRGHRTEVCSWAKFVGCHPCLTDFKAGNFLAPSRMTAFFFALTTNSNAD